MRRKSGIKSCHAAIVVLIFGEFAVNFAALSNQVLVVIKGGQFEPVL